MKKANKRKSKKQKSAFFVYIDESGNTGLNLFDDEQPFFMTGALIAHNDVQIVASKAHRKWTSQLNVGELHGSELGIEGIRIIATELEQFLSASCCHFLFSLVEKRYHAGTMFAQMIFDTDFNRAVSPMHDFNPLMRRMLTLDLLNVLTFSEARDFWKAYVKHDLVTFSRIVDNLQVRVLERCPSARERDILLDALSWASLNSATVLQPLSKLWASPSILAVDLLLQGIHKLVGSGAVVVRVFHDEQRDFGNLIKESYNLGKNVQASQPTPGSMHQFQRVHTFQCPMEFVPSQSNIGVQIIDVILWLVKWRVDHPNGKLPAECISLLAYVDAHAEWTYFTYEWLKKKTMSEYRAVMATELTPEQEAKGRATIENREKDKLRRMTRTKDD